MSAADGRTTYRNPPLKPRFRTRLLQGVDNPVGLGLVADGVGTGLLGTTFGTAEALAFGAALASTEAADAEGRSDGINSGSAAPDAVGDREKSAGKSAGKSTGASSGAVVCGVGAVDAIAAIGARPLEGVLVGMVST